MLKLPIKSGFHKKVVLMLGRPDVLGEVHKKTQHSGQNTAFNAEEMAKKCTRRNGNTA